MLVVMLKRLARHENYALCRTKRKCRKAKDVCVCLCVVEFGVLSQSRAITKDWTSPGLNTDALGLAFIKSPLASLVDWWRRSGGFEGVLYGKRVEYFG
jgi:hypothetical protein